MSSPPIQGLKRVLETIRRNTKDTGPGSNGDRFGTWFVRIFALGCGVGIGRNLVGDRAKLREQSWRIEVSVQENLERLEKLKELTGKLTELTEKLEE